MTGNRAQRRALQREQKKAAKKEAKRAMKLGNSVTATISELDLKKETPSVVQTTTTTTIKPITYQQPSLMIKELNEKEINIDHDIPITTSSIHEEEVEEEKANSSYEIEKMTIHEDLDYDHQSIIIPSLPTNSVYFDNNKNNENDIIITTLSVNDYHDKYYSEDDDEEEENKITSEASPIVTCQVNVTQNVQLHENVSSETVEDCDTHSTLKRSSYSSPNDTLNDLTTFASSPTLNKKQSNDTLVNKKKKKLSRLLNTLKNKSTTKITTIINTDKEEKLSSNKTKKKWQFWKKTKKDNILIQV